MNSPDWTSQRVPAVPGSDESGELARVRTRLIEALAKAEAVEREARSARSRAAALARHYDGLLEAVLADPLFEVD